MNVNRIARWKRDLQIASSWATAPLLYLTFAELLYSNSRFLKTTFPSHAIYVVLSALIFIPMWKIIAKIVIGLGLYEAEMRYNVSINPFQIDQLTEKEKTMMRLTIVNVKATRLILRHLGLLEDIKDELDYAYEAILKLVEDAR